jgi:hypothetical protein
MRFVAVRQDQHFLCAPRPATVEASVGMCPQARDVTVVWDRIELPYGRVALRTPHGRFLSCQVHADGPRMGLTDDLGPREAFEEILWPDGAVSLRTCELTYLSVRGATGPGGGLPVACNGIATGAGERFRYVEPPTELLSKAVEIVDLQPQVPDMPRQFAYSSEELRDSPNGNGQA